MVVTDSQVDNIREDIRVLSHTMSDLMKRVSAHDARFDQVDRRLDQHDRRFDQVDRRFDKVERRLDGIDQVLQQILTLVSERS